MIAVIGKISSFVLSDAYVLSMNIMSLYSCMFFIGCSTYGVASRDTEEIKLYKL